MAQALERESKALKLLGKPALQIVILMGGFVDLPPMFKLLCGMDAMIIRLLVQQNLVVLSLLQLLLTFSLKC